MKKWLKSWDREIANSFMPALRVNSVEMSGRSWSFMLLGPQWPMNPSGWPTERMVFLLGAAKRHAKNMAWDCCPLDFLGKLAGGTENDD